MQFADNSGISVKYMLISLLIKHTICYLAYKYSTLATRQRDAVVVRTVMVVPSTMFKVYDPPNSETLVLKLFLNFPVVNMTREAIHVQFPIRKLIFTIIPIAREGSINYVISLQNKVTLYFKVSLLQCNFTFNYRVILHVLNIWFGLRLGFGLGLRACNYG